LSISPLGAFHFSLQVRAFAKYYPSGGFGITGFAGVKGNLAFPTWVMPNGAYPIFGVRGEALYFYLEYAAVLRGNFSNFYSHGISIGFSYSTN